MMSRLTTTACALAGILAVLGGCSGALAHSEELDVGALPESVRPDYAVFAQRCSKCHSLSRPLTSGIDEDDYWVMYVAKMRRQPESGISQDDTVVILRFLHYFSLEQKKKKGQASPALSPTTSSVGFSPRLADLALEVPRPAARAR
jgi:hypothetical protein